MNKTNYDHYLEDQLKDPDFAIRYAEASEAWDIEIAAAIPSAILRNSQTESSP